MLWTVFQREDRLRLSCANQHQAENRECDGHHDAKNIDETLRHQQHSLLADLAVSTIARIEFVVTDLTIQGYGTTTARQVKSCRAVSIAVSGTCLLRLVGGRNQFFAVLFDGAWFEVQLLLIANFLDLNRNGVASLEGTLQQVFGEWVFDIGFDRTT